MTTRTPSRRTSPTTTGREGGSAEPCQTRKRGIGFSPGARSRPTTIRNRDGNIGSGTARGGSRAPSPSPGSSRRSAEARTRSVRAAIHAAIHARLKAGHDVSGDPGCIPNIRLPPMIWPFAAAERSRDHKRSITRKSRRVIEGPWHDCDAATRAMKERLTTCGTPNQPALVSPPGQVTGQFDRPHWVGSGTVRHSRAAFEAVWAAAVKSWPSTSRNQIDLTGLQTNGEFSNP